MARPSVVPLVPSATGARTGWPRSVTQPPLTRADRLVFRRLAQHASAPPQNRSAVSFTDTADEGPLADAG